ncbi:amidase [Streptococcus gallinaceus]|uniref:Amidase n=1 Tax=Streptococcus gallinaceus TaxID=165758 RepID=A0ABV2JM26_9STRE|nr:amidase [Streptococcus gallinaceus]MCP1639652.1 amidase [Streptococcus gallinaceus]MCP1770435.1 amidase [Streptococcus gallinaceus]
MWRDTTEMAQAVREKKVSSKELVTEAIEKIERLNPQLNAVVSKQYEQALEKAEMGDFSGKLFGGVPILLKDLGQQQVGELATSGSRLFANNRSRITDNYVKKLEELGFVILGRTNTPEFGFKNISDSSLHGAVNLPADTSRNAGGSSGGAAAAVSSGMVPLAAASDGGGSIRIPASFNGLIGLKPSRGRVPVGPTSFRGWQGASSQFAITKSVRDTRNLLYGMQVCQLESPFPHPLLNSTNSRQPLKIAYSLESPIGSQVSDHARNAVLSLLPILEKLGHHVSELTHQPIDGLAAMRSYYIMNSVETAQMFDEIEAGFGRTMTPDDMELMTWAIFRSGQKIPAKVYSKVLQDWDNYSAQMWNFHRQYDLLLTPTVNGPAPRHGQFALSSELKDRLLNMDDYSMMEQQDLIWEMFADSLAWTPFTQSANLTGQPAISLPTYETDQGLPLGVQFTAAKGGENLLLQLASDLEDRGLLK